MFKIIKQLTSVVAMFAVLFAFSTETMAAKKSKTLENTKKRGFVRCGVSQGLPGFSNADESGNWTGIDVDVCRAVAAATLGDATKVKFTPLSAKKDSLHLLQVKLTFYQETRLGHYLEMLTLV